MKLILFLLDISQLKISKHFLLIIKALLEKKNLLKVIYFIYIIFIWSNNEQFKSIVIISLIFSNYPRIKAMLKLLLFVNDKAWMFLLIGNH